MAINNNFITGGIFCYVEKTFDCVDHKILSSKLELCGVTGKEGRQNYG
jgi:hypothetical protein